MKNVKGFPEKANKWKITTWIIIINVFFFFLINFLLFRLEDNIKYFALKPDSILHGQFLWTLLVHMFSHVYFLHLFVNMFALFSFGGLCEKIIGRKRFFVFYLIAGLIAGILSVILAGFFGYGIGANIFGSPDVYMLGASGAIFGVAGLLITIIPRLKFSIIFLPFWSFPGYIIVPLLLIILWGASIFAGLPVGNVAHFGGFITGLVYGFYLKNKYKRKVLMLQRMFR